ncbi:AAA family ATPase [Acinetobacter baumannii]|uniref:AAA family ATPase n=1 Tax=Acinetobacter baumannii TaxID=470 RepID=UPI00293FCC1D|nr:ATP-binding protein [Acinetobacter baumannii]MDV4292697.1 ATP-binding protein [Acinetobacter baumannii]
MLVNLTCENILSFKNTQSFSMIASQKKKDNILLDNFLNAGKEAQEQLLETALIFGANGSGKTNFIASLSYLKALVLDQLPEKEFITPFLLNDECADVPSELEVEFYAENSIKYRYGLSLHKGEILEEWLYYTPLSRETLLFHRENETIIEYNSTGFFEAKDFINEENKIGDKVKSTMPFIFLLATFKGEHSSLISKWFSKIKILDIKNQESKLKDTLAYWKENTLFKEWATPILNSLGICDIRFDHKINSAEEIIRKINEDKENIKNSEDEDARLKDKAINLFDNLIDYVNSSKVENKEVIDLDSIKIIKKIDNKDYAIPLKLESSGTVKLIHLLSALYNSFENGDILLIDEFDVQFHTLLSKYIFKKYHETNNKGQIIATVHDTNLMDTNYFRRDQIWFVDKNFEGESKLYSLVEFKELASNISNKNYSNEYLVGFFNAIPLFENSTEINKLMEDPENG